MLRTLLTVIFLCIGLLESATAGTEDCAKNNSSVGRLICSDAKLGSIHDLMNEVFDKAVNKQIDKAQLRQQQQGFLRALEQCGDNPSEEQRPCISQLLTTRTLYLSTLTQDTERSAEPAKDTTSPAKQYEGSLMKLKRHVAVANFAAICGFRSDAYFERIQMAFFRLSVSEANRLKLKSAEISLAERNADAALEKENSSAQGLDRDIACQRFRTSPKLVQADDFDRQIIGGYR